MNISKETFLELLHAEDIEKAKASVIQDYKYMLEARQISDLAYSEMKRGHAAFAIGCDGKELPQVVLARFVRQGDYISGYYRDLALGVATGLAQVESYLSHHYNYNNFEYEPFSGGRQMTGHFGRPLLDREGQWKDQTKLINLISGISPTAAHLPRILGLAKASAFYQKDHAHLKDASRFSSGKEIVFATLGDASTAEGHFFETINVMCAQQLPILFSIWDDGYGISVESQDHNGAGDVSKCLAGFAYDASTNKGMKIFKVKGWDYWSVLETYNEAERVVREEGIPAFVHVIELSQPQGHSSSGDHRRYKSKERLQWEIDNDNIAQMRQWMLSTTIEGAETPNIITEETLEVIEKNLTKTVKARQKSLHQHIQTEFKDLKNQLLKLVQPLIEKSKQKSKLKEIISYYKSLTQFNIIPHYTYSTARKLLQTLVYEDFKEKQVLIDWLEEKFEQQREKTSSHLYTQTQKPEQLPHLTPKYDEDKNLMESGKLILRKNFDKLFENYPELCIFGEDVEMGDVNLGLEGLKEKYAHRIFDTGIAETTIIGMGVGLALRGLRPIAEIQYLDYLDYGLTILTDDLATLHYRSAGGQKAPLIVRTRGHRLQGIWHAGSPMGMILNSLKGMYVLSPRNFTVAAGFYNALMMQDNPALVIEPLNAYEIKEPMVKNLGEFYHTHRGSGITSSRIGCYGGQLWPYSEYHDGGMHQT